MGVGSTGGGGGGGGGGGIVTGLKVTFKNLNCTVPVTTTIPA